MKVFLIASIVVCCAVGAFALTHCQEHRERELKNDISVKLVPKCDANGDYEALQCFTGSKFCMCWRPDGSHITDPSRKIKTCKCHVHRDTEVTKSNKGMVGNFIPECNNEGTYAKKQCHASTGLCWCSDEDGNKTTEPARGEINC